MRRLVYVPIVHQESDMGSIGTALAQQSAAMAGEGRWALHKHTVCRFWASVQTFLLSLDAQRLRLYQDGMAADGEMGRRIVEEGNRLGSRNYAVILELLTRGAELRQTEDPQLLLREHENLRLMLEQPGGGEGRPGQEYRRQRDSLVEERDRFIAASIDTTLREGELGVLFLGAYHSVESHLPEDISVEPVKGRQEVIDYLHELFDGHDERRLEEMARALAVPVSPM